MSSGYEHSDEHAGKELSLLGKLAAGIVLVLFGALLYLGVG
jgi:hypothetical protein